MNRENIEKEVREKWFEKHTAEFEKLNDRISILDWINPNSSCYYCRYVFDGSRLYVSGDIGEAVFRFTEKATLEGISKYDLYYFHSKLSAFCENKYSFDSDTAIETIKEHIEYARENMDYEEDDDGKEIEANNDRNEEINNYIQALKELIIESKTCNNKGSWDYEVEQKYDDLRDYDCDVSEWIYTAGDVIPNRIVGYLIGLKMALEQLKEKEVTA